MDIYSYHEGDEILERGEAPSHFPQQTTSKEVIWKRCLYFHSPIESEGLGAQPPDTILGWEGGKKEVN